MATMQGGAAQAFIAFLRCEATQAEERAKSLRATAAAIEANMDGGARKRKRKRDVAQKPMTKKIHTAYTLFIHESYEMTKKQHSEFSSKELISIMTRQWEDISEEEKRIWKYRAEQMKDQNMDVTIMAELEEMADDINPLDLPTADDDGGGGTKRAAAKKPGKTVSV